MMKSVEECRIYNSELWRWLIDKDKRVPWIAKMSMLDDNMNYYFYVIFFNWTDKTILVIVIHTCDGGKQH